MWLAPAAAPRCEPRPAHLPGFYSRLDSADTGTGTARTDSPDFIEGILYASALCS